MVKYICLLILLFIPNISGQMTEEENTLLYGNMMLFGDNSLYYHTIVAITGPNVIASTTATITNDTTKTLSDRANGSRRWDGYTRWKEGILGNWDSTLTYIKVLTLSDFTEGDTIYYDFVTIPIGGNDSYSNGADSLFIVPAIVLTYLVNKVGNKAMLFKTGTYAIKLKD